MERYKWKSLLLLFFQLQSSSSLVYNTHTLEAPQDLQITDPGYLGLLRVKWSPPDGVLLHMGPACRVRFHLTYFNTYHNRWSVIQTPGTSRRIQVDLSKEVKVRVHSLLNGPCTNHTEVKSTRYAEVVRTPGLGSPVVQWLGCVFHRMEYTECTWKQANHTSLHRLYYWYGDSGATRECPKYILDDGARRGCNFTRSQLPVFSLVSICVNSSSPSRASTPVYSYLKIQNHVKPAATEELGFKVVTDVKPHLQLEWTQLVGRIPGHCLQWEVEHISDGPKGSQLRNRTVTMETSLRILYETERTCYRVRSKLAYYCAKHGIWSDWSHWECQKDNPTADD